jgi:hypothetical protein
LRGRRRGQGKGRGLGEEGRNDPLYAYMNKRNFFKKGFIMTFPCTHTLALIIFIPLLSYPHYDYFLPLPSP